MARTHQGTDSWAKLEHEAETSKGSQWETGQKAGEAEEPCTKGLDTEADER